MYVYKYLYLNLLACKALLYMLGCLMQQTFHAYKCTNMHPLCMPRVCAHTYIHAHTHV